MLSVRDSSSISGDGIINASVSVESGGVLAPDNFVRNEVLADIGAIDINGDLSLFDGAILEIDIFDTEAFDVINVTNNIIVAGPGEFTAPMNAVDVRLTALDPDFVPSPSDPPIAFLQTNNEFLIDSEFNIVSEVFGLSDFDGTPGSFGLVPAGSSAPPVEEPPVEEPPVEEPPVEESPVEEPPVEEPPVEESTVEESSADVAAEAAAEEAEIVEEVGGAAVDEVINDVVSVDQTTSRPRNSQGRAESRSRESGSDREGDRKAKEGERTEQSGNDEEDDEIRTLENRCR